MFHIFYEVKNFLSHPVWNIPFIFFFGLCYKYDLEATWLKGNNYLLHIISMRITNEQPNCSGKFLEHEHTLTNKTIEKAIIYKLQFHANKIIVNCIHHCSG
jgi:hypothetical protein